MNVHITRNFLPIQSAGQITPTDAAWTVLDAANDVGDLPAVEACRRVIDANFSGQPPHYADLMVVNGYFR